MLGNDLLGSAVASLYNILQSLNEEIKTIDRQIETFVESDTACQVLMTIPGVGPITALAFSSSVGDPNRFKKSRSVGAYFGLTPRRYQSGEMDFSGRISRTGDMAVRTYLYEAAGVMLSRTKGFSALKAWGLRIKARSGWKKACIAVARKLAVIMHRMLLTGECFRYANLENKKQAAALSAAV
jgi:transposase